MEWIKKTVSQPWLVAVVADTRREISRVLQEHGVTEPPPAEAAAHGA